MRYPVKAIIVKYRDPVAASSSNTQKPDDDSEESDVNVDIDDQSMEASASIL